MSAVSHPLFARAFDGFSRLMERELGGERTALLAGLSGRVLEVGAGNGMNFSHYPSTVEEVVAVEPEPYLRAKAERAATAAPVPVRVQDGVADALPLEPASVDAAVLSLVLCTVPNPPRALAELRRVLKPGGQVRFMEHVRARDGRKARIQLAFDHYGIWPRLAGGCHCARDTVSEFKTAGFQVQEVRSFDLGPTWGLTNPHVRGQAVAPA